MVKSFVPETLNEAIRIRAEHSAVPVSGGTDILVRYRNVAGSLPLFPWSVMYIGNLRELRGIFQSGHTVVVRAGTKLSEVEQSALVPDVLKQAVHLMAAPALRNLGTLAGNICNASPAGDALCVLYTLRAEVELATEHSMRRIPVEEFITGPGTTVLADDELMTAIHIPADAGEVSSYYRKVGTRKANALSKLSCAGRYRVREGKIDMFRLALGAVGPTVVCDREIEERISGFSIGEFRAESEKLFRHYSHLVNPIDDQRSTAEYRKKVCLNLIHDFIQTILGEASE